MNKRDPNQMSREQASELYRGLRNNSAQPDSAGAAGKQAKSSPQGKVSRSRINLNQINLGKLTKLGGAAAGFSALGKLRGHQAALGLVILFTCAKVAISAMEHFGVASVEPAQAATEVKIEEPHAMLAPDSRSITKAPVVSQQMSREDVVILTQLDVRRAELEERDQRLDLRQRDIEERERSLATQMSELRTLTDRLKIARDQDDHHKDGQLDQLSKVYSAMNPDEAAHLMEQLDVTIALSLIERMPDKRIGQILAIMSPDKALQLTKMLSGTSAKD